MASPVASNLSKVSDLLDALKEADSPTVSNAIERFGVRDRCDGYIGGSVQCLFPELGPVVGKALTVRVQNRRGSPAGKDGYWGMWKALEQLGGPSVVVAQDVSGDPSRCAFFGEVMTHIAMRLGAIGMITDGGVRDLAEVRALGFSFFAPYPVVSHANFEILDVGQPVTLDGQDVSTGDILHGDRNGIVVVPPELLERLPDAIRDVRNSEARTIAAAKDHGISLNELREISQY